MIAPRHATTVRRFPESFMNRTFVAIVLCAFLAVVVFYFVGGEKTFASPQECFDAARAALKKNDMAGFCECLTTESRDLLAAITVINESLMKQMREKGANEKEMERMNAVDKVF